MNSEEVKALANILARAGEGLEKAKENMSERVNVARTRHESLGGKREEMIRRSNIPVLLNTKRVPA